MEARAAAERAVNGATRASDVIKRIRSLINKTPPEKVPVQLNEVIEEVVSLTEGQASRNNVSVAVELAPELPIVLGDRIQFQQVILNLMMNGIEAMAGVGDSQRQLHIKSCVPAVDRVCVSIRDTGIGVGAESMERLFEPFFTTRSEGIGMGLPISLSIIEAHGGRLWAESTIDQSSVFQFTLPTGQGV